MYTHSNDRQGIALATALIAIVLIGALIAGTFFVTGQEYRVTRNALTTQRALTAAEYGQNMILKDWVMAWNQTMKTGDTIKRVYLPGSGASDSVIVTRVRFNMFWVVSTGRTGSAMDSESRRRTGMLVRLDLPMVPFPAAFNGGSKTTYGGNYTGSGTDSIPAGWTDCPPSNPTVAAIATPTAADQVTQGSNCLNAACLSGNPKTVANPQVSDSTKVLDNWAELVAGADKVWDTGVQGLTINQVAPTYNPDGSCNRAYFKNWGDPARAMPAGKCEDYFPVIHIKSAITGALGPLATFAGGRGQGVLLVDANIMINGGTEWTGPIIVRGNVSTGGVGNKVIGGIAALNQGCVPTPTTTCNQLAGTSNITFSSCSIQKALSMKAPPILAKHHAWADMY